MLKIVKDLLTFYFVFILHPNTNNKYLMLKDLEISYDDVFKIKQEVEDDLGVCVLNQQAV